MMTINPTNYGCPTRSYYTRCVERTEPENYKIAKNTLAIVNAPPSAFNLRASLPSADWQFHLAGGCPAHSQYGYLAESLAAILYRT